MTSLLAWRNLLHDPVRFAATLIGIVFSITLMSIQAGLLNGFSQTASGLVDHAGADIWIASRGTLNVDQSVVQTERSVYKALQNDGIASMSRLIVRYVIWRKPNGGTELVILVGADPALGMGGPWNIDEGSAARLSEPNAVMIDRLYLTKLGFTGLGQEVEIATHRARIIGLTNGVRTFTQSPYVFTSYNNAVRITDVTDGSANYFLVKAKAGQSIPEVAERLRQSAPNLDVFTTEEFAAKTQKYWIYTTGAGSSLLMGAILGAMVGVIIVAQTLYAATMERLAEYATLSAIGASGSYLNRIVVTQALISGGLGYAIGITFAVVLIFILRGGGAAMILTVPTAALIGVGAILMCVLASLLAIRKLMRIDPTSVFK